MSKIRRIANVLLGLLMVACCFALIEEPGAALTVVAVALGIWLLGLGISRFVYYATMARHMVGGLSQLFIAVIATNLGGLSLAFTDQPRLAIVVYVVGYNTATGIVGIMRVLESRKMDARWELSLARSIANLALALGCIIFIGSDEVVVLIFCIGLFYAAITRFVRAIKPTEVIYIQ